MRKGLYILTLASSALTFFLFLPYSLNISRAVVNVIDPLFYAWNLSHNADSAFAGVSAMLNSNIFYPLTNTIAYSDTLWAQSIFTSPIIWLTHNPILAENLAVLLSFPFCAVSFYLLAQYLTGNTTASVVAGLFFAFSYPRLAQIGHLPMASSQWLPLYMLSLFQFLSRGRRRDGILLCLWYVLSITSSIYFGVMLIPVTLVVLVADLLRQIRAGSLGVYRKRLIAIMPVAIPFIMLIGVAVFPYIRLKAEYPDIKRNLDEVTNLRAAPVDYISVLPTSPLLSTILPTNINEHVLFPTITVLLLALIGIFASEKHSRFISYSFLCIALISILLSLGNEQAFAIGKFSTGSVTLPYTWLYNLSPLFQTIRVPARFSIFVILSLSALAALGIQYLIKKKKTVLVALAIVTFLMEIWQVNTPFVFVPLEQDLPKVYTWIGKQTEPLILADLPISLFYHGANMEDQLQKSYEQLGQSDTYALETYRIYFSAYHKKRMINGYSGFLPDSYNRLAEELESFPADNTIFSLQDIGVTHIVIHLWQYDDTRKHAITEQLENSRLLTLAYSDENDRVYTIHKKQP